MLGTNYYQRGHANATTLIIQIFSIRHQATSTLVFPLCPFHIDRKMTALLCQPTSCLPFPLLLRVVINLLQTIPAVQYVDAAVNITKMIKATQWIKCLRHLYSLKGA